MNVGIFALHFSYFNHYPYSISFTLNIKFPNFAAQQSLGSMWIFNLIYQKGKLGFSHSSLI